MRRLAALVCLLLTCAPLAAQYVPQTGAATPASQGGASISQSGSSTPSHGSSSGVSQYGAATPTSGTQTRDHTACCDAAPMAQEYPRAMSVIGLGGGAGGGADGAGKFCNTVYGGKPLVNGSSAQCIYATAWRSSTCACGGYTQSRDVHSVSLASGGASDYTESQGACNSCQNYTNVGQYAAEEDARAAAAAAAAAAAQAAAEAAAQQAAQDAANAQAAQDAANAQAAADAANAAAAAAAASAAAAAAAAPATPGRSGICLSALSLTRSQRCLFCGIGCNN